VAFGVEIFQTSSRLFGIVLRIRCRSQVRTRRLLQTISWTRVSCSFAAWVC